MKAMVGFKFLLLSLVAFSFCIDKDEEFVGPGRVTVSLNPDDVYYSYDGRVKGVLEDACVILERPSGVLVTGEVELNP